MPNNRLKPLFTSPRCRVPVGHNRLKHAHYIATGAISDWLNMCVFIWKEWRCDCRTIAVINICILHKGASKRLTICPRKFSKWWGNFRQYAIALHVVKKFLRIVSTSRNYYLVGREYSLAAQPRWTFPGINLPTPVALLLNFSNCMFCKNFCPCAFS